MYGKYKVISLKPFKMIPCIAENPIEHLARIANATEKEIQEIFKINKQRR